MCYTISVPADISTFRNPRCFRRVCSHKSERRRASLYFAEALILEALNTVELLMLDAAMRVLSFWLKGSSCARQSRLATASRRRRYRHRP